MRINNKVKLLGFFSVLCFDIFACSEGAVKVIVYNTSNNILLLQAKDEHTCKLHNISRVRPGIKGKYCINHDYMLKVTTLSLHGDTRLAITSADLWDDLIISTPKEHSPDVEFHNVHNDIKKKVLYQEESIISKGSTAEKNSKKNTKKESLDSLEEKASNILDGSNNKITKPK
jgi:hypothetical protein